MRICILMGSPRLNGNTAELCKPFMDELLAHKVDIDYIPIHGKNIAPCLGCYRCQNVTAEYGCVQQDDMQAIVESVLPDYCERRKRLKKLQNQLSSEDW